MSECLPPSEVQVWVIDTDRANEDSTLLDPEERARAARFVRRLDRDRFIRAHCALRRIIAAVAGLDPQSLQFGHKAGEKPVVLNVRIPFSLSHSGRYALVAVASSTVIGVDIEFERATDNLHELARLMMSQAEFVVFAALAEAQAKTAFFDLWTRKEALLKATGSGFRFDPRGLDLGFQPHNCIHHDSSDWTIRQLLVGKPGVHAAIAVKGNLDNRTVVMRTYVPTSLPEHPL